MIRHKHGRRKSTSGEPPPVCQQAFERLRPSIDKLNSFHSVQPGLLRGEDIFQALSLNDTINSRRSPFHADNNFFLVASTLHYAWFISGQAEYEGMGNEESPSNDEVPWVRYHSEYGTNICLSIWDGLYLPEGASVYPKLR